MRFLVGFILVWRAVVLWTLGRKWLTALVGMIPFVQVVYGQPLWDAGCVSNDFLRIGQEQVSVGVWIWCSVWVWWIVEKRAMSEKERKSGGIAFPDQGRSHAR
ncbi:MAG: hypothetical protein IID42_12495 [Planctomycetes bacterium]|nr:hypothetical protein [Planctomycetota bacterium]